MRTICTCQEAKDGGISPWFWPSSGRGRVNALIGEMIAEQKGCGLELAEIRPMNDFELPVTRYAQSGEVNVAYQTMGEGPIDLIIVPGIVSHVEFAHEFPAYTHWLSRLAKFALQLLDQDRRHISLMPHVKVPYLAHRPLSFR